MMYRRLFVILLAFSLLCLFSCGEKDEIDNTKPPQEQPDMPDDGNEDSEESNPEDLPDFCDVQSIEGWTNVRFCKNGMVIFTKNYDSTQQVNKVLMFVPTEACGITSIYGEYDESGFPKYLSFDDAVVFVEDYKDGLVDLTVIQGEESMWAAEDLDLSQPVAVSTRAWSDNNWVRNTCAVGGVITSSIGIGAGVVVTGATGGVGSVLGGGAMIAMSSQALVDNLDTLFGAGDDFVFSEYATGKMQGICMETMVDMLLENEESYLQTLWPDKFNFKKGAPNVPSTFWLDLAMEVVDAKWGKTVTEADKRRAFIIAHLGYKIETGRADDIKLNSATLYGYISPEAMEPLGKFAEVEYGIVLYPTADESKRVSQKDITGRANAFSLQFNGLEYDTKYTYYTYYYDKTNAAYRQGELKTFKTKGEGEDDDEGETGDKNEVGNNGDDADDDETDNDTGDNNAGNISQDDKELRELLIKFYQDTGGDNWHHNSNWCTDAPIDMWYGVYESNGYYELILANNNLTGSGSLSNWTSLKSLNCEQNQLASLNVTGCVSLKMVDCDANQLVDLDVSGCILLDYLSCTGNQFSSLKTSSCTSLKSLYCYNDKLVNLDVSDCISLEGLSYTNGHLTSLNVSGCTSLEGLSCENNQLTNLDVSNCTSLDWLDCSFNRLSSIDVSVLKLLRYLECSRNQLTILDTSDCSSLEVLGCWNNQLSSLNVSNCMSLDGLGCNDSQLTVLNVSNCTSLEVLDIEGTSLKNINIESCISLRYLYCYHTPITQEITEFYDRLITFQHDQRYSYPGSPYENLPAIDNGVGWWYPGEPQKGYHGK